MKKNLQTAFITRQHMLSRDFELYYYNDHNLSKVDLHSHNYYEFYFFMEGDVSIQIGTEVYPIHFGDIMLVPPHIHIARSFTARPLPTGVLCSGSVRNTATICCRFPKITLI